MDCESCRELALMQVEKARKNIEIAMKLIDYPESMEDDWDLVDGCLENMKWKIKKLEIESPEAEDPTDRQVDEMILEKLESEYSYEKEKTYD